MRMSDNPLQVMVNNYKGRIDPEWFWQEVKLLAENNFGDFTTGEQVEVNVNQAIDLVLKNQALLLKASPEAKDVVGQIIDNHEL